MTLIVLFKGILVPCGFFHKIAYVTKVIEPSSDQGAQYDL